MNILINTTPLQLKFDKNNLGKKGSAPWEGWKNVAVFSELMNPHDPGLSTAEHPIRRAVDNESGQSTAEYPIKRAVEEGSESDEVVFF